MTLSKEEQLYRIANHIASAKGGLPEEWQTWADEIESDLRKLVCQERDKQEITGWRALQNDNRDLREPLYLDGFNDPVGWNSDYAPVYAAPPEPVAQPVQMPTVAKLKEIYSLFCTPTTGSDNAMTAIHKSCRASMLGATISNSADFAIVEGSQAFGNSEQLEPASQTYTLRDGLEAIRKLGPIDTGNIQAERDALNEPTCWCLTCRPVTMTDMRFVVCPNCGNKRCPKANDHSNACSGSNEPGQEGSAYPAAPKQESE